MAKKSKPATGREPEPAAEQKAKHDPNLVEFTYCFERIDHDTAETSAPTKAKRFSLSGAESAARHLWQQNGRFAQFMYECSLPRDQPCAGTGHVRIPLVPREVGLVKKASGFPEQEPFAAVVGCVDARAPVELLFAQGFDDLYITRIAGNTLGADCAGSLHYAVHSFAALAGTPAADLSKKPLRLIVALGHSDCGAVTAAVNTFLDPAELPKLEGQYLPDGSVGGLLAKIHHPAVAMALEALPVGSLGSGPHATQLHLAALIDLSVYLNAAWTAHETVKIIQQYEWEDPKLAVEARYGVFDPRDCYVRAGSENYLATDGSGRPLPPACVEDALRPPPADLKALKALAAALAEKVKGCCLVEGGMEHMSRHYRVHHP